MCQVIPEYLYLLSPAIALYQVLSFSTVYSIIFVVVPPLAKYKYDNPNTTGRSATTVICALADLSVIVYLTLIFPSLVTRGANLVAMLASSNKHSWRHRRKCNLSVEDMECQQAFLVSLPGRQ
jgi:hypothetical protein